jgi:hypothetical protein
LFAAVLGTIKWIYDEMTMQGVFGALSVYRPVIAKESPTNAWLMPG